MYFIISTDLIPRLVQLLQSNYLRSFALSCLIEIAGLQIEPEQNEQRQVYLGLLRNVTVELLQVIPLEGSDHDVQIMLQKANRKNPGVFEVTARNICLFYS